MTKIEELEQKLNEIERELKNTVNAIEENIGNEIDDLRGALAELKESKKENVCKWKPQIGEKYWFRSTDNFIGWLVNNYDTDEWRINNMPVFPTEEQCQRYWHFMDTVKEKSYEFSDLEWQNNDIKKWVIQYDYMINQLVVVDHLYIKQFGLVYFKDKESAQYIIDNFKDELIEYWI